MQSYEPKEDEKPQQKEPQAPKHADPRNSSIVTEGPTLSTIAGPIHGWKCCPENLPNHPTSKSPPPLF